MNEIDALARLAEAMGVYTRYTDGLGDPVTVAPETLVRVCAALGAPIERPADAREALRSVEADRPAGEGGLLPPVIVAWDGALPDLAIPEPESIEAELLLENGGRLPLKREGTRLAAGDRLPAGYHRLRVENSELREPVTVIAAPEDAWRAPGSHRSWGVAAQLAALRSARSRSLGDLRDLESLSRWVIDRGGDLVMLLPLLPTFNREPAEPSPYAAVSRLFWSELILDLEDAHRPAERPETLDVTRADAEVRAALAGVPAPDPALLDDELLRYARFRGAQARLGRNWRDWPAEVRAGAPRPEHVDSDEERFHLVAQTLVRRQLDALRQRLEDDGMRLGLDLAVGIHPDGYDVWSRQGLFAPGMSVGAPPDAGFPSGQDWGFPPVLPEASRREGHRYLAASIAHQAALAGVLRVDHIMALTRLYWIPHGFPKDQGTYVTYPQDELFALLTLESHRHRCEIVGENLGTVPPQIEEALPRHRIRRMYLAQFEAGRAAKPPGRRGGETPDRRIAPPADDEMALVGTHDTPTLAGWLAGVDIEERVRHGLLAADKAPLVRRARGRAARKLAARLGCDPSEVRALLGELLEWLGASESPLVVPWLEDLWLEERGVNLPGTTSSERPNWQRPMRPLLDEILTDPAIGEFIERLERARRTADANLAE